MKKKVLSFALALMFVFALMPVVLVYANDAIGVTIDGEAVIFSGQQPVIADGRTLVPVRGVFEMLGFEVDWNPDTRQATLARPMTRGDDIVVITIGNSVFTTNGTSHTLDVPAQIIGGSTMLPIRAVLESVGSDLDWDAATRTVTIESNMLSMDDVESIAPEIFESSLSASLAEMPSADATNMLSSQYINAVRREFERLINNYRRDYGLRELTVNLALQDYADLRAAEQRTRWGHARPDGSAAGSGWYNQRNVINSPFAENAAGVRLLDSDPFATAYMFFSAWRDSPCHNRHMLFNFAPHVQMAFGIYPEIGADGRVTSGAIFASGFELIQIDLRAMEQTLRSRLDAIRQEEGLPPLQWDDELNNVAATIASYGAGLERQEQERLHDTYFEPVAQRRFSDYRWGRPYAPNIAGYTSLEAMERFFVAPIALARDIGYIGLGIAIDDLGRFVAMDVAVRLPVGVTVSPNTPLTSTAPQATFEPLPPGGSAEPAILRAMEEHLIVFINAEMQQRGLPALSRDDDLSFFARAVALQPSHGMHGILFQELTGSERWRTHSGSQGIITTVELAEEGMLRSIINFHRTGVEYTHVALAIEWNQARGNGRGMYVLSVWFFG